MPCVGLSLLFFRQSIKSSFRDKDKPSRFKDLQTTTRFQVDPENEVSEESNDSQEERELLENEYDTKYGKSFRSVALLPSPKYAQIVGPFLPVRMD